MFFFYISPIYTICSIRSIHPVRPTCPIRPNPIMLLRYLSPPPGKARKTATGPSLMIYSQHFVIDIDIENNGFPQCINHLILFHWTYLSSSFYLASSSGTRHLALGIRHPAPHDRNRRHTLPNTSSISARRPTEYLAHFSITSFERTCFIQYDKWVFLKVAG